MSPEELGDYLRLLAVVGIVALLQALSLVLAREWVKNDLTERGFRPIRVRWWPWTCWPVWGPAFRVLYADDAGAIHQARCGVCAWRRPVVWRDDQIVAIN
jgi:hypothetical protein